MKAICPLCSTSNAPFYQKEETYYKCETCDAIYADELDKPNLEAEKERYELHDDDTADEGYRKFVNPITSSIMRDFTSDAKGLDFGAGTSAIISVVLKENAFNIKNYDPYFHRFSELLEAKYDYISSCEVIEHFYKPYKEFKLLKTMLNTNGKIYLMTEPYDETIDFSTWYYKNDPTHVFFYSKKTFAWIVKEFKFSEFTMNKRLIVLNS